MVHGRRDQSATLARSRRHFLTIIFGPETWFFLTVSLTAVTASVSCAAMCLLSLHGRKSEHDMAALGVRTGDLTTYRPEVLWYFGHLARLDSSEAVRRLRSADREVEIKALTFNVVELSGRVLRKHRYVNAGWMFTAAALIALAAGAGSLVVRA